MILKKLFTITLVLLFATSLILAQEGSTSKSSEKPCCEKSNIKKANDCESKVKAPKSERTKDCCNKEKTKSTGNKSTDCCMEKTAGKKSEHHQKLDNKKESDKKE